MSDLISRSALMQKVVDGWLKGEDFDTHITFVYEADIMNATAVEAKPVKRGHWIDMQYPLAGHTYISCSECGEGLAIDSSYKSIINYCPSCGADMRGGEDGR